MLLLAGGRVVTPGGVLSPGWIRLAGPVIDAVGPGDVREQPTVDLHGQWVLPGFVDLHVHGGGGVSFTEGTEDDARAAAAFHRGRGWRGPGGGLRAAPNDMIVTTTHTCGLLPNWFGGWAAVRCGGGLGGGGAGPG